MEKAASLLAAEKNHEINSKIENFDKFSQSFYSDSLFQISRINFPLSGVHNIEVEDTPLNELGNSTIHEWKKTDWQMLRNTTFKGNVNTVRVNDDVYVRKLQQTNTMAVDSVYIEDSGFAIVKKFSMKNGKWYLTNYSEYNY